MWRAAPRMHARLQLPPAHSVLAPRRGALLLQLLDAYAVRYSEMLDGRSCHMPVSELAGGARIRHIFQEIFVTGLQNLNPSGRAARAAPPRWIGSQDGGVRHGLVGGANFDRGICCTPESLLSKCLLVRRGWGAT